MKKKNKFLIYTLIVIGFVLIITNSCEKDETTLSSKQDPIITWSNPADISFGALLSATQLNATADVSGTFIYTPPLGAKLNVGLNQNLKVDFTPTDEAAYNSASKTAKINVNELTYGAMTDQDGNVYKTINIGTQTWMAENLKTTKYRDGSAISNITGNAAWATQTEGAYCWYNNNIANKATYGALYNYYTIVDSRNLCPAGWHVPSDAEWTTLTDYLINNGYSNWLGGSAIAKSLAATSGWTIDGTAGNIGNDQASNNSSGFTALPGGYRSNDYGNYQFIEGFGYWWSATGSSASSALYRGLQFSYSEILLGDGSKKFGFSVVCLKNL